MDITSFIELLEGVSLISYTFGMENHSCVNGIMNVVHVLLVDDVIEIRGDREDTVEIHVKDIQSIQPLDECNLIAVYLDNGILSIYYGDPSF